MMQQQKVVGTMVLCFAARQAQSVSAVGLSRAQPKLNDYDHQLQEMGNAMEKIEWSGETDLSGQDTWNLKVLAMSKYSDYHYNQETFDKAFRAQVDGMLRDDLFAYKKMFQEKEDNRSFLLKSQHGSFNQFFKQDQEQLKKQSELSAKKKPQDFDATLDPYQLYLMQQLQILNKYLDQLLAIQNLKDQQVLSGEWGLGVLDSYISQESSKQENLCWQAIQKCDDEYQNRLKQVRPSLRGGNKQEEDTLSYDDTNQVLKEDPQSHTVYEDRDVDLHERNVDLRDRTEDYRMAEEFLGSLMQEDEEDPLYRNPFYALFLLVILVWCILFFLFLLKGDMQMVNKLSMGIIG